MGDFVVYRRNKMTTQKQDKILKTLSYQGSHYPHIIKDDLYTLWIFPKSISPVKNYFANENGEFCCSSGCFFYRGQNGENALKLFLQDFNPDKYSPFYLQGYLH